MSLPKLCLFALAATLQGFAAVENAEGRYQGIRGATPRSRPQRSGSRA